MQGQMELFAKAPIWHVSLNHSWVECPNCHSYNTAQTMVKIGYGKDAHYVPHNLPNCPECGQLFDWSYEAIENACKYSKDYPREAKG